MIKLTIIRGVAGSGKSTEAENHIGTLVEADMFFIKDGVYDWYPEGIHKAHKWCQDRVRELLESGEDVIVSNTSLTLKELNPYWDIANTIDDIHITIIEMKNLYESIHNVPEQTIERMKDRMISNEVIQNRIGIHPNYEYLTIN